jgi:ABC-type Mn2+/Zn2+ transport system ATPase subunit
MNLGARDALLTCEGLIVGHRGRGLLPPIDLAFERGRITCVLGRNGAGKTTLIRTILGQVPPVAGRVRRIRPDLRVTYVPQASQLDPVLPIAAAGVVSWGRLRGWSFLNPLPSRADREARDRALREAGALGLGRVAYRDLSLGQKQRVLIARLLADESEVAILDEPTASLDVRAEEDVTGRIVDLARRGVAIVLVVHDLAVVRRIADVAVYLDREGGRVIRGEPNDVLSDPAARARDEGAPPPASNGARDGR